MKRIASFRVLAVGLLLFLLISLAVNINPALASANAAGAAAQTTSGGRTYTVLVGAEESKNGVGFDRFFPSKLVVHVGDTVTWKSNSNDIHTVTFMAGQPPVNFVQPVDASLKAPSPLEIAPQAFTPAAPANGQYDGSTYANSGIMSMEPGMTQNFSLTFTKEGTYTYLCLVHGMSMMGEIDVVNSSASILSPETVSERAAHQIEAFFGMTVSAFRIARLDRIPDDHNADGTTTHYVMMGASAGAFDLMRFFPSMVTAKPGDTIVWYFSPTNMDPHTVTFLNGTKEPGLVMPFPVGSNPPQHLLLDPQMVLPANAGGPLNDKSYINSGLLMPGQGPQTFSIVIDKNFTGLLTYVCLLHDGSGMVGYIKVAP